MSGHETALLPRSDIMSALIDGLWLLEMTKTVAIAAAAFYCYNVLLTIDDEILYIWKDKQWTTTRLIYVLNRVVSAITLSFVIPSWFLLSPSHEVCRGVTIISAVGLIAITLGNLGIIILRIWVLYNYRRRVIITLSALLTLLTIMVIAEVSFQISDMKPLFRFFPTIMTGCLYEWPQYSYLPYLAPLAFETLLFILCLWKIWNTNKDKPLTPLLSRLMRDGTLYYIIVILMYFLPCIGPFNDKIRAAATGSGLHISVLATMSSRLVLSLKSFNSEGQDTSSTGTFRQRVVVYQSGHMRSAWVDAVAGGPSGVDLTESHELEETSPKTAVHVV